MSCLMIAQNERKESEKIMLTKKEISAITIVLISTLIVGVYAGSRLSPTITASWVLASGNEIQLSWNPPPPSTMSRQQEYIYGVRIENMEPQSLSIWLNFTINADLNLPLNSVVLLWGGNPPGNSVGLTGWGTQELRGVIGFGLAPGANATTYFGIYLLSNAPVTTYSTYVWAELFTP